MQSSRVMEHPSPRTRASGCPLELLGRSTSLARQRFGQATIQRYNGTPRPAGSRTYKHSSLRKHAGDLFSTTGLGRIVERTLVLAWPSRAMSEDGIVAWPSIRYAGTAGCICSSCCSQCFLGPAKVWHFLPANDVSSNRISAWGRRRRG